jgi:MarR family transcriptional regulator, transcriptional regulator for hemolysin
VPDQPDLLMLLHDLARHVRLDADRRASAYGLTRAQWFILSRLERRPGLSQKELAEIIEVEPITVGRLIDRLEASGMVERRADPDDRRIWRLHLLPAALPVLRELHAEREDMLEMVGAGLDAATLDIVKNGLARMKANVVADLRAKWLERDVA